MNVDDIVRLRHMVDAAASVGRFIDGRTRDDLDQDQMLVFAVVRAIEVIGEAAARISADGRAELPQVPWSAIVSMRNRLVHGYFDVDLDVVWATATKEVPSLAIDLESALRRPAD